MKKKKTMVLPVVGIVFALLISVLVWAYLDMTHDYKAARAELIELLKSSDDVTVLESMTQKEEAAVLYFSSNEWMAILYIDNHGPGHPSTVVIRCSDDKWFYTHDGVFSSTGLWWEYLGKQFVLNEKIQEASSEAVIEGIKDDLRGYWPFVVDELSTLDDAKKHLFEIGFKRLKTP